MAGRIIARDTACLVLGGIMAVGLVVALAAGTLAIVRSGKPDAEVATLVAEIFAWIFAVAFLASFGLVLKDSLNAPKAEH